MPDQLGKNSTDQRLLNSGSQVRQTRAAARRVSHGEERLVVNASEKRYLWTARAFAVVTAISLCCNLILLLTISNILPLYRVEPYLVTFSSKESQVYNIVPYNRDMVSQKSITETFVRQYVLLRTTLLADVDEMSSRWDNGSDLQEMSSDIVYRDFRKNNMPKLMKQMKDEGLTSTIKITVANEIEDGIWQVEYVANYYTPTSYKPRIRKNRATLVVEYRPRRVQYKERLKNPVGFKVVKYTTQVINKGE